MNRLSMSLACLIAFAAPALVTAQDLAVTAGSNAKIVLDNDKVRVIEVNMPPGSATGMHSHGAHLVIGISGGTATQTMADGSTRSLDTTPGEVRWSDPVTHDTRNTGKAASRSIVIELKDPEK